MTGCALPGGGRYVRGGSPRMKVRGEEHFNGKTG